VASFGMLDWFAGKFSSALDALTRATAELAEVGAHDMSHVWFVPNDARAAMHVHLALARYMAADIAAADVSIAQARAIAEPLEFPQGPWSTIWAHWLGSWIWLESGRLDEARVALEALRTSSELHGFNNYQLIGATHAVALEAVAALGSAEADTNGLAEQASALISFIEFWKALDLRFFLPFYLTTCGALLAASGDPDGARQRYEESLQLAGATGMHFYDAETCRRVAQLASERESKIAALRDALELARSQAARPFELRIALDLYELLGDDARRPLELAVAAFPADASTSELDVARARVSTPR
jgi:tetratricopeptide (TPR) repeat protein